METKSEAPAVPPLTWAIVEVMGHSSYGGSVREIERLGARFLEVTVMATYRNLEFTMLVAPTSIFRMRYTTEAAARANYSSVPSEFVVDVPRPGRLTYEDASERPHSADAAMSIEAEFSDDSRNSGEIYCDDCGCEITRTSAQLHGGRCADCQAEADAEEA